MSRRRVKVKLQAREVLVLPATEGAVLVVRFSDDTIRLFGQADEIYVEGRLYGIDPNFQVEFGIFTGALGRERPYPDGLPLQLIVPGQQNPVSWAVFNQEGRFNFTAEPGAQVDTEPVMILRRTDTPPYSTSQKAELEAWASLTLLS